MTTLPIDIPETGGADSQDAAEPTAQGHEADNIGETSDGYHTFNELYEFRLLYNAALWNEWAKQKLYKVHKSWHHADEPHESIFGKGWFIVVAELPTGQISNHYPPEDWTLFQVTETPVAHAWDGHTAADVADRLRRFVQGNDLVATDPDAKKMSLKSAPVSSGSQDSIDTEWIEDLTAAHSRTVDHWLKKDRTIGEAYAEANREALHTVLAWHNTQLKSVLQSLRELSTQEFVHSESSAAFDEGRSYEQWRISRAIDDMERNINAAS